MIIILNISVSDIMKGRLCYFCYITAQISHYKRSLGTLLKKRIRARETMQCCVIQRTLKRLKINLLSSSQYCSSTQIFYGKVEDSRSTRCEKKKLRRSCQDFRGPFKVLKEGYSYSFCTSNISISSYGRTKHDVLF